MISANGTITGYNFTLFSLVRWTIGRLVSLPLQLIFKRIYRTPFEPANLSYTRMLLYTD
jgi:hypothetical protein